MTYLTTYSSYHCRHVAGFDIVSSYSRRFIFDLFATIFRSGAPRWTSWTSFFVVIVQRESIKAWASLRTTIFVSKDLLIYQVARYFRVGCYILFFMKHEQRGGLLKGIYILWIYLFFVTSLWTSVFNHDRRIFQSYIYSTDFYEVFMALKKGTRKNHLTSQEQVPSDRCRRYVCCKWQTMVVFPSNLINFE